MIHVRREPAAVESTMPPVLPEPVPIGTTGRIGWPGVVIYVTAINGATVRSPVPPPAGIAYRCVPARPGVLAVLLPRAEAERVVQLLDDLAGRLADETATAAALDQLEATL